MTDSQSSAPKSYWRQFSANPAVCFVNLIYRYQQQLLFNKWGSKLLLLLLLLLVVFVVVGTTVAQLVRCCATNRKVAGSIPDGVIGIFHWDIKSFRPHYGPGVDWASNRNEYREHFLGGKVSRCVGLTTVLPLCADCLEIWEPQPPGTLRTCPGL